MKIIQVIQEGVEFPYANFKDHYGNDCSIELSTIVEPRCIWLGKEGNKMHLSLEQVEQLLPILQRFVETGDIVE